MKHYEKLANEYAEMAIDGSDRVSNLKYAHEAGYKAAMEELNKYSSNPEHESFTTLIKSITDMALIYLNREEAE